MSYFIKSREGNYSADRVSDDDGDFFIECLGGGFYHFYLTPELRELIDSLPRAYTLPEGTYIPE